MVGLGETAPDFTLVGTGGDTVSEFTLSEFAEGSPTVLVFYIYDYSPVCTAQMCEVNDAEFLTFDPGVRVLGISTDGPYSHQQFMSDNNLSYPLLTDGEKRVYERYDMVERAESGVNEPKRGVVLLDGDRTVRYRWEAADNWDEWDTQPIAEVNSRVGELEDDGDGWRLVDDGDG